MVKQCKKAHKTHFSLIFEEMGKIYSGDDLIDSGVERYERTVDVTSFFYFLLVICMFLMKYEYWYPKRCPLMNSEIRS